MKTIKIIILFTLLFNIAQAQVIYTDVVPDASFSYPIDINNDGEVDFKFIRLYYQEYDTWTKICKIQTFGDNQVAINNGSAAVIQLCEEINNNYEWSGQNEVIMFFHTFGYGHYGNWYNVDHGFVGLKINTSKGSYYSWVRIQVQGFSHKVIDYAYNTTAGEFILAGNDIPPGATSVYANDQYDYFDGRDIHVSFTKALIENNFSEYRVILTKSDDTTAYNLEIMNQVPPEKYHAVLVDTTSEDFVVEFNFDSTAIDKDGDLVMNFTDYKIHLLNISISGNPADNVLSSPSPAFIIQAFTQAIDKTTAWDDGNNGTANEISVSFNHVSNEYLVNEYRIFIAKTEDALLFDVAAALSLPSQFYMAKIPDGNNVQVRMNEDLIDIKGNNIISNNEYSAIILSVADSVYSKTSALSPPSRKFILKNPSDITAGKKTGDSIVYFEINPPIIMDFYDGDSLEFDMNQDGEMDFVFTGKGYESPMFFGYKFYITTLNDNKVLLCDHANHENWVGILFQNEQIGEEYRWYDERAIFLEWVYDAWSGENYYWGHLLGNDDFYVGLCIMNNGTPVYGWVHLETINILKYKFLEVAHTAYSGNALPELSSGENISVYPNPANNFIIIQVNNFNLNDKVIAKLYNSQGIFIKSVKLSKNINNLDVSKYPAGIYYCVTTINSTQEESIKFLVY